MLAPKGKGRDMREEQFWPKQGNLHLARKNVKKIRKTDRISLLLSQSFTKDTLDRFPMELVSKIMASKKNLKGHKGAPGCGALSESLVLVRTIFHLMKISNQMKSR
jgi:hypothetical protein